MSTINKSQSKSSNNLSKDFMIKLDRMTLEEIKADVKHEPTNASPTDTETDTDTSDTDIDDRSDDRSDDSSDGPIDESLDYKCVYWLRETHRKPLYGVHFNPYLPDSDRYFATVGSNRVTVYECRHDKTIRLAQCFEDPDKSELYYTCVWSVDDDSGAPLIISAGIRGIIRVINCAQMKCVSHLIGHGSAINDLRVNPFDHNLLLSGSKDHSIRLWNVRTEQLIAIFGGESGHRDEVLCVGFHTLSNSIISSGMDHAIKIWSLDGQHMKTAIDMSYHIHPTTARTPVQHFPRYTTRDIHDNYVDCVEWFGNFVLSKASDRNEIVCWKSDGLDCKSGLKMNANKNKNSSSNKRDDSISIAHQFLYRDCNVWFVKFSVDEQKTRLAMGNQVGVTYVWNLDHLPDCKPVKLVHPNCNRIVRQTSFSGDRSILICVCDDSTVWRWDLSSSAGSQ